MWDRAQASLGRLNAAELKHLFNEVDKDESGAIDAMELKPLLERLCNKPITVHRLAEEIKDVDVSGDGQLQFQEFVVLIRKFENKEPVGWFGRFGCNTHQNGTRAPATAYAPLSLSSFRHLPITSVL